MHFSSKFCYNGIFTSKNIIDSLTERGMHHDKRTLVRLNSKTIMLTLIIVLLTGTIVSAQKLYPTGKQVIAHDGRGNRIVLQGNVFNGEICSSHPSFYTVNYKNQQVFVKDHQLTTRHDSSTYLNRNIQFMTSPEIVTESETTFHHSNDEEVPNDEYLVPVYWGTKGIGGPRAQAAIDNFVVTGDFNADLTAVVSTVINMNLTYGGDPYKQIDAIETGFTKCLGATWLTARLLDQTNIEYRFILQRNTNSLYEYDFTNPSHMYLEIKDLNGTWKILEPCELLNSPAGKAPQLEDVIWGINHTLAKDTTLFSKNITPTSYHVLLKSVGFRQGQVITPAAEKVILNNY